MDRLTLTLGLLTLSGLVAGTIQMFTVLNELNFVEPKFKRDLPAFINGSEEVRVDLTPIFEFQPFGASGSDEVAPEIQLTELDQTEEFSYHLSGIILESNAQSSRAIISTDAGQHKAYKVGDELDDGSKILKIEFNRVTVNKLGQMSAISFPNTDSLPSAPDEGSSGIEETNNQGDSLVSLEELGSE